MPIIPRSDRNATTSGQPLPFSTGDGYEAPGRAMMRVGDAIGDLGGAFDKAAAKAEAEREQEDLFKTKLALTEFSGEQEVKHAQYDAGIADDGRGHADGRVASFDEDWGRVSGSLPQSKRAQQYAQLEAARMRAQYRERAYATEQRQMGVYYEGKTTDIVTRQILPTVSGDIGSAERALGAIDGILAGANGMPPAVADRVKRQAAEQVFKAWLDKAGPEAAVQVEGLRNRYLAQFNNEMEDTAQAVGPRGQPIAPGKPMDIARQYLGSSEGRDATALASFFRKAGGQSLDPRQTAWCAAFVNAVLGASGVQGTGTLMARDFLKFGTATKEPTNGDIVVLTRGDPNGPYGHVGFYAGKDANGNILVLGGNQGDKVSVASFPASQVLGYRKTPEAGSYLPSGVRMASAPRTTSGYFLDRVMQSAPQIERAALAAERRQEVEERRAVRQDQIAAGREALELVAKGQLTRDWVEQNGPRLNATDFRRYSRMTNPIVRATVPDVLSDLVTKVDEDPQSTMDEALDAYSAGTLSYRDLSNIITQARAHMSEQNGVPRWTKDERAQLKRAIKPPAGATGDMHKAYVETLAKWDAYVAENRDGLDRASLRKFTQTFIDDARTDRLFEMKNGLETPRTVKTSREAIDLNAITAAKAELAKQLKAGTISREDAATEAKRLKAWQDTLEQEAIAKGKPLPGTPGAAASGAPKKSGQKSSEGPSRTVPVSEMQRRAKDLEPDPALNVGAP